MYYIIFMRKCVWVGGGGGVKAYAPETETFVSFWNLMLYRHT
jgi:hypothetical protein